VASQVRLTRFGNDDVEKSLTTVAGRIVALKLKEPGLETRLFQFLGGEEKSPYEGNCITPMLSLLDAIPTGYKRWDNDFH